MTVMNQELTDITSIPSLKDLKVIDVDAHWSEPHDLWTSRCPASMKDKVPRVVEKDGDTFWVFGEDQSVITPASPASVIRPDGTKIYGGDFYGTRKHQVHEASFELGMRLDFMDKMGIHAQVVYPNVGGLKPTLFKISDDQVRLATIQIYNDASLEWQAKTNERILPMAAVPFWDVDLTIKEAERTAKMGSRGITITGDVHACGVPDLGHEYWNPLWEYCSDNAVPVNFHIGGSEVVYDMLAAIPWPSLETGGKERARSLQSCAVYQDNARTIGNLILTGVCERFPKLRFVSVESGVGWIPFYLEGLDYQIHEQAATETDWMTMKPSEYFKQNFYASWWFETNMGGGLKPAVDAIGADRIMFETDFPHPTCLYPDCVSALETALKGISPEDQKKLVQGTAADLYKLDV